MDKTISDLAIFGNTPEFCEKLYVGRPNIGNRERFLERVNAILDRKWLTNDGPYLIELENKIAGLVGVKHCVLTCNATIALEIMIRAAGLTGEVIVPSFTFIATVHSLEQQGITPIFCDVDPCTHNLDPNRVKDLITQRTSGIMGVHLWGRACDTETLEQITQDHHLKLLFDAAHAFGCSHNGILIGNFGEAEVFSFHATKFFNTFEGGAIVTNDDELADKARLFRNFGFSGYDHVISLGTNGKMSEISAAMGLTGLESLAYFVEVNHHNYLAYQKNLHNIPGVQLISYNDRDRFNYQYIVLEIDERVTGISRDDVARVLEAENVFARRYFSPGCHNMEPYRTRYPGVGRSLPVTERLAETVLTLPNGTAVDEFQVERICDLIGFIIQNGDEIRERIMKSSQIQSLVEQIG